MTIGTSTFYTIKSFFAIEIFGFFQLFFEFIVNFALFLCFLDKFFKIYVCQNCLCNIFYSKTFFGTMSHFIIISFVDNCQNRTSALVFVQKFKLDFVQKANVIS